jgi:hypothetical protein
VSAGPGLNVNLPRSLWAAYTQKSAFESHAAAKITKIVLKQFLRMGHLAGGFAPAVCANAKLFSRDLLAVHTPYIDEYIQHCTIPLSATLLLFTAGPVFSKKF